MDRTVFTVGHSVLSLSEFSALLAAHGIAAIADVRRFPASRRHPHFSGLALANALATAGVAYHWFEGLGGRRAMDRARDDNAGWRVAAFRGYADHTASIAFQDALASLEAVARSRPTAFMCAEAQWTKCHRRLIADALVARGWRVRHIVSAKRVEEHCLPDFARVDGAVVRYPSTQATIDGV